MKYPLLNYHDKEAYPVLNQAPRHENISST